jgi:hypothetical protein
VQNKGLPPFPITLGYQPIKRGFYMYEVQHFTLCDGWVNTWLNWDNEGNSVLETFETFADACMALDDFLADELMEFEAGNIESPYEREEFRIVKLEEIST